MKKVLKILTLVMLIFTIIKIGDTYAKFYTKAHTENLSREIGKWVIHVNEMKISEEGETVEFEVDEFENFSNTHSAFDKISPSSKGYVDIVIDPTGTDVAVRYDVEIELTGASEDLAISAGLEMASGENNLKKTGLNTYTGTISLADVQAGKTADTRCYLIWENDENKNNQDTEFGNTEDVTLTVKVKVTVTQYLGETINEYGVTDVTQEEGVTGEEEGAEAGQEVGEEGAEPQEEIPEVQE